MLGVTRNDKGNDTERVREQTIRYALCTQRENGFLGFARNDRGNDRGLGGGKTEDALCIFRFGCFFGFFLGGEDGDTFGVVGFTVMVDEGGEGLFHDHEI